MAKQFDYEILDIVGVLEERESNDWCKVLMKVSWDNEPAVLDIRNINLATLENGKAKIGKGISLSDDALMKLASILLQNGYLNKEECDEYFESHDSIFKVKKSQKRILKVIKKGKKNKWI